MPNTGTTIALAAGGLVAAEATGLTNFSGGGGPTVVTPGGGGGGGGGGIDMPIPIDTGGSGGSGGGAAGQAIGGIAEAFGSAMENAQSGVPDLGLATQIAELRSQVESLQEGADTVNDVRETIDETVDIPDIPGDGPRPTTGGSGGGGGGGGGGDDNGLSNRQEIAREEGRDPFGLQATQGGVVGSVAEGLRATGETVTDVTDSIGSPGRDPEEGTFFDFVADSGNAAGEAGREVMGGINDWQEDTSEGLDSAREDVEDLQSDLVGAPGEAARTIGDGIASGLEDVNPFSGGGNGGNDETKGGRQDVPNRNTGEGTAPASTYTDNRPEVAGNGGGSVVDGAVDFATTVGSSYGNAIGGIL